ncbi:DUF6291 domain-containing protein [uncultured Muribaculum sp.]|uniref:DUF6291 domain-containing protein n=1 Tax=uncultured Muribaculum sp. TaxID=1918613 RepID=UPI0025B0F8D0|nr:DUF6291 domain-containing protein [uncultured Muribaculum sp.]
MSEEFIRNSFTWYKSFEECIAELDEHEGYNFYRAISRYSLYGEKPEFDVARLSLGARMAWRVIFPVLRSARAKSEGGQKGGKASKTNNPTGKKQYKVKQEVKQDKDKDKGKDKGKDEEVLNEFTTSLHEDHSRDFIKKRDDGTMGFDYDKFIKEANSVGHKHGFNQEDIDRFISYTTGNMCFSVDNPDGTLYDRDGNPLKNWIGAFIRFVNSGYKRDQCKSSRSL